MLNIPKRVQPGTIVMKRGDKYVRCSPNGRPFGVFQDASNLTMITDNGPCHFQSPRGIVCSGMVHVALALRDRGATFPGRKTRR